MNNVVVVGYEVVGVGFLDFGVMVLELDSSFGGCFCLELGGVKEWISNRVVSMVNVTGRFVEVPGMMPPDQARKAYPMFGAKALVPSLPWCFI